MAVRKVVLMAEKKGDRRVEKRVWQSEALKAVRLVRLKVACLAEK